MYKKMIFMVVIVTFIAAPAFASNGIIADLATGVADVFGALFGIGQTNTKNKISRAQLQELKEKAHATSEENALAYANKIEADGIKNVQQKILHQPRDEGDWKRTPMVTNNQVIGFTSIHKSNGWINECVINIEQHTVRFTVRNTALGISENAIAIYHTDNKENEKIVTNISSSFDIFSSTGFDIADGVKSNEGYLIVSGVRKGSVVSTFGMLEGTELYQIDNMNTKQCTADEVRSYIAVQAEKNATIAVYFMDENGKSKRVDVKL